MKKYLVVEIEQWLLAILLIIQSSSNTYIVISCSLQYNALARLKHSFMAEIVYQADLRDPH